MKRNWVVLGLYLTLLIGAAYVLLWAMPSAQFVLPYPHKVVAGMVEIDPALGIPNIVWIGQHVWITLIDAFFGFAIGSGAAILLSVTMVFVPQIRGVILGSAIAIKSVPWIMLIPILMLLLGPNMQMRVALVGLACFFLTLVNFYTGLGEVEHEVMDYTRTLPGITKMATFRYVQWPYAMPYLFAAFKTSAGMVILSAVVVEWLVSGSGLGYLLYVFNYRYRMDLLVVLAIVAGLLSYGFMRLVSFAEKYFVDEGIWRGKNENQRI